MKKSNIQILGMIFYRIIFIFGLARTGLFGLHDTILSPPAWALEIKLTFYIAIGLGLGKRKFVTIQGGSAFAQIFKALI